MGTPQTIAAETPSETIDKILLAAEAEFAEHGFDGAGMKALARRANVSQALLHYHFGTKDHLYGEVIRQRSRKINDARAALLSRVDLTAPDALDGIFDAFFRPPLGAEGGEETYARIFSSLVIGREREQALVKECYDPSASRFIDALEAALPGARRETVAICYSLALGALVAVIGRDGRLERLMGNAEPLNTEALLARLIPFARAGAQQLVREQQNTK